MEKHIKWFGLVLSVLTASACTVINDPVDPAYYPSYHYSSYTTRTWYPQNDYRMTNYGYEYQGKKEVTVPDSYHVGAYRSPVSFKDRDRSWVQSQNPQSYTIEVADDEKASQVAQKLYQAPKNDRRAQVQYQKNGKSYYKGLYGSYDNAEAAQKALEALPPEVKQNAGVKNWGNVQTNLNE